MERRLQESFQFSKGERGIILQGKILSKFSPRLNRTKRRGGEKKKRIRRRVEREFKVHLFHSTCAYFVAHACRISTLPARLPSFSPATESSARDPASPPVCACSQDRMPYNHHLLPLPPVPCDFFENRRSDSSIPLFFSFFSPAAARSAQKRSVSPVFPRAGP